MKTVHNTPLSEMEPALQSNAILYRLAEALGYEVKRVSDEWQLPEFLGTGSIDAVPDEVVNEAVAAINEWRSKR